MLLHINEKKYDLAIAADIDLLSVLRDRLALTGAKYGCGEGACGACTVLVDGKVARACITPVGAIAGKQVLTIEGLEKDGRLHPVQAAFLATDAFQCSYCASGMIMRSVALLEENPSPGDAEIIAAMNGNICRCGTYLNIIKAIKNAIKQPG